MPVYGLPISSPSSVQRAIATQLICFTYPSHPVQLYPLHTAPTHTYAAAFAILPFCEAHGTAPATFGLCQ